MGAIGWSLLAAISIPILWLLIRLLLAYTVSPSYSGRAFLIQKAKRLGVNVTSIPDAAWNEIVAHNLRLAKAGAERGDRRDRAWRSNLVILLEGEAIEIAQLLRGEGNKHHPGCAPQVLANHGVIRNGEELA